MKWIKRISLGLLTLIAVLVLTIVVAKAIWDSQFYAGYDAGLPLDVQTAEVIDEPDAVRVDFSYQGVEGMRVPSVMFMPKDGQKPYPALIFLHGIGQSKSFLKEIYKPFTDSGYAIVTFDQYMRGGRKLPEDASGIEEGLAFRRRAALTVLETRRMVDYLQSHDDIAADRIYLVGASYGAITGATAAAMEPRIRAVVLTYGGGNLPLLLASDAARGEMGKWTPYVTRFTAWYLKPSDPINYVGDISPRPVLIQNGTHDQLIPTPAANALFEAANQPKEQIIYEGDHVGLDEATTRKVLDDALHWIEKQDAAATGDVEDAA